MNHTTTKLSPITVRFPRPGEGQIIRLLMIASGMVDILHGWDSPLAPYWLLAARQGEVIGALQVCYGIPMCRLDILALDPNLTKRERAQVILALGRAAVQLCVDYGATVLVTTINEDRYPGFGHVLQKHFHCTRLAPTRQYVMGLLR